IPAGGRLLLALAMRLVDDLGGTYAMCDTDSLFVAATSDGGRDPRAPELLALAIADVLDHVIEPFAALNPYDRRVVEGSILELKPVNLDATTAEPRLVSCYAIASKRYALFTENPDGLPRICVSSEGKHRSEHGLGHALGPFDLDDPTTGSPTAGNTC